MSDRATIFPGERDAQGGFDRQPDAFRARVTADGGSPYPAVAGRYHLYVSLACPWAHRIVLLRRLKRLENVVGMTVVDPVRNEEDGWAFNRWPRPLARPGQRLPSAQGSLSRHRTRLPGPRDRARALGQGDPVHRQQLRRRPAAHVQRGVRRLRRRPRGGFLPGSAARADRPAQRHPVRYGQRRRVQSRVLPTTRRTTSSTSTRSSTRSTRWETRLGRTRFLHGATITESDWRLFVTLVRFDAVYVGHFKCNLRRIADYPNLSGVSARPLPDPRRRGHGELRPHQAPLLRHAPRHQSDGASYPPDRCRTSRDRTGGKRLDKSFPRQHAPGGAASAFLGRTRARRDAA